MIKERLYYWLTVLPLAVMFLYLYAQHKDQQQIIDRLHKISNRQVEIMGASYTELLDNQSIKHANEITRLKEHHKQEIGECVAFYGRALDEAKGLTQP